MQGLGVYGSWFSPENKSVLVTYMIPYFTESSKKQISMVAALGAVETL